MFSMAGIPPLVGFYAKFAVLEAAVNVGLTWLAVVGVVMSLIGAFYYLRVVKAVYFDEATGSAGDALTVGGDMKLVLGVNGLVLLGLGILPNGLYTLCLVYLPVGLTERYIRLYYTVAGSNATAGKITAGHVLANQTA